VGQFDILPRKLDWDMTLGRPIFPLSLGRGARGEGETCPHPFPLPKGEGELAGVPVLNASSDPTSIISSLTHYPKEHG
jgi:hypothetical protein